ncbi:hypothetical protein OU789_02605 [Halocynthiibacter sp. C4]|uniref:hypothetical protein n=1 Tax=Halocynthiibacter sp. C4 TaxID=2992758 RepID=UPI00237C1046|nr:hypothetical protein [Halocynthiibacter sp. C4]MDE0588813.1 hypothetical protein [Halocynthiibacter sp. C4]
MKLIDRQLQQAIQQAQEKGLTVSLNSIGTVVTIFKDSQRQGVMARENFIEEFGGSDA